MKAELNIKGMHCASCAADIQETLQDTAGVNRADVNYNGKQAIIEFDDAVVQPSTLIKKIQDLGYQATIAGDSQSGVGAGA